MALNGPQVQNGGTTNTDSSGKRRNKSSNQTKSSPAQTDKHTDASQHKKSDKHSHSSTPSKTATPPSSKHQPIQKPPPAPKEEPYVPLPGYNANDIDNLLSSSRHEPKIEIYKPSASASTSKQSPWAAKPGTMANGKDFWLELRKQIATVRRDGGAVKGG